VSTRNDRGGVTRAQAVEFIAGLGMQSIIRIEQPQAGQVSVDQCRNVLMCAG
jgi:hypothetical protein